MRADAPPGPSSTQIDRLLWVLSVNTITEAARELRIPERTARYWAKMGKVPTEHLERVAEEKRVPLGWLMRGHGNDLPGRAAVAEYQVPPGSGGLLDTAWPAYVVRKSVAAVRDAEEHSAVRLNGEQLADAVCIVVQMAAISPQLPQQLAATVIGTMVTTGQVQRKKGDR